MTVDHETFLGWLTRLKLTAIRDQLDNLLDEAAKRELSLREALAFLVEREIARKDERRVDMAVKIAHFPCVRDLDGFDFAAQPSLDPRQIRELAACRWVAVGELARPLGLEGMDLAGEVSCRQSYSWDETVWRPESGYGTQAAPRFHVVAVDYGAKRNILRMLAEAGCRVTVVPANATAGEIMRHRPDGIFLSNGPGDPAATGEYAVPVVRDLIASGKPVFGICLGHQLMALALGGRTRKMAIGHRGANHPVKELANGRVEITSQNHGFVVDPASLPAGVVQTHVSLFDGSNEGLRVQGKPVFSVQHHPEASPGPKDSNHLFRRFVALMEAQR